MDILVVHTGGTISCEEANGVLAPKKNIVPIFHQIAKELMPTLKIKFTHKKLSPILSENLNGSHLVKIANEVQKGLLANKYSGVIVTHGSDTIAYTSALLSYIFGTTSRPVVTVCADLPLSDPHSSGHTNLRAAAILAASNERGVFSVYRDTEHSALIHRGSRLLRHRAYETELSSVVPYGKVIMIAPENPKIIKDPRYSEASDELIFDIPKLKKTSDVAYITVYPGMVYPTVSRSCKAVILGSYHSGTLDTAASQTVKFAKFCKKRDIPIFVDGIGTESDYESMSAYSPLGLTRLPPLLSPCAAYIKLWLLTEKGEKELTEMLYRSCGGDIIPQK